MKSCFISVYRDFSRSESIRAKLGAIVVRYCCYLYFLWTVYAEVLDLSPLLVMAKLEIISDVLKRVFDYKYKEEMQLHPKSFTLTFLFERFAFRSDFNLLFSAVYYTLIVYVLGGQNYW